MISLREKKKCITKIQYKTKTIQSTKYASIINDNMGSWDELSDNNWKIINEGNITKKHIEKLINYVDSMDSSPIIWDGQYHLWKYNTSFELKKVDERTKLIQLQSNSRFKLSNSPIEYNLKNPIRFNFESFNLDDETFIEEIRLVSEFCVGISIYSGKRKTPSKILLCYEEIK